MTIRANRLTQILTKYDSEKLPDLFSVMRKWNETARSYKYTSTIRKAHGWEMIAMFRHQNTAANYVKIITLSKSMSGGGLRGGSRTTHSHTPLLILSHSDCRPTCMVCVRPGVNRQPSRP